jgi:hypothetical protein
MSPNAGEGGDVAGSQPMSTAAHMEPKLWRSNSIFNFCVNPFIVFCSQFCTDKKKFLTYKEIQNRAVAKSYMRKGFLIYEEIRKYFPIY